jgi:hypothetical protein
MQSYDPATAPNSREWLSIDEAERIELVRQYHEDHGDYGESLEMHAGIHAVVETQIAMDIAEVRKTLQRLRKQGLNRHDAIHAIGTVLAEHMHALVTSDETPTGDANEKYYEQLSKFNVSAWYSDA